MDYFPRLRSLVRAIEPWKLRGVLAVPDLVVIEESQNVSSKPLPGEHDVEFGTDNSLALVLYRSPCRFDMNKGQTLLHCITPLHLTPWLTSKTRINNPNLLSDWDKNSIRQQVRITSNLLHATCTTLHRLILSLPMYDWQVTQQAFPGPAYSELWDALHSLSNLEVFCCVNEDIDTPQDEDLTKTVADRYRKMQTSWPELRVLAMRDMPISNASGMKHLFDMRNLKNIINVLDFSPWEHDPDLFGVSIPHRIQVDQLSA
jgi:hypothetical protein